MLHGLSRPEMKTPLPEPREREFQVARARKRGVMCRTTPRITQGQKCEFFGKEEKLSGGRFRCTGGVTSLSPSFAKGTDLPRPFEKRTRQSGSRCPQRESTAKRVAPDFALGAPRTRKWRFARAVRFHARGQREPHSRPRRSTLDPTAAQSAHKTILLRAMP